MLLFPHHQCKCENKLLRRHFYVKLLSSRWRLVKTLKHAMKTRKDSTSNSSPNSSAFKIEVPFSGVTVYKIERKLTTATLIRVLLGLVVFLTFLGNIIFILETRKMNLDGEKQLSVQHENVRQTLPRSRDATGSDAAKKDTPSKSIVSSSSIVQ